MCTRSTSTSSAVKNTLTNAFRNGVADRVTAAAQDLYPWVPEERYDVIVASLYQMPVDPFEQAISHRPLDYWGRNLLDHLINMLPEALAEDGTAYIMQLSIIGERRTARIAGSLRLPGSRRRLRFFEFSELFKSKNDQIARVEEHSDAYHLTFGETEVMVAYLLEITRKERQPSMNSTPNEFLFTSESVTEGHPDKIADQISDGVLDAVMRDDPMGRVACETLVNTGLVVVSGEITTTTYVDIQEVAREHDRADRLHGRRVRLRLQDVRGDQRDRQAVARHRAGRRRGVRDALGRRAATTSSTSPARVTRG